MNRGYAGFYKNTYLRSSYEYAFAKYLDYKNIEWKYEEKEFDIGHKIYKPDFFIYKDSQLLKIAEIKSSVKSLVNQAKKDLIQFNNLFGIEYELITYTTLRALYEEMPDSLYKTIQEWVNSENTTLNKSTAGELNAHFGMKHSDATKIKIGEATKLRWANSKVKERMLDGARKSGYQKGDMIVPRENRKCPICNESFKIIVTSKKVYCNRKCRSIAIGINHAEKISEAITKMNQERYAEIYKFVEYWCKENKELVFSIKQVLNDLQPLLLETQKLFNVKDIRVISKIMTGKHSRKELKVKLQSIISE